MYILENENEEYVRMKCFEIGNDCFVKVTCLVSVGLTESESLQSITLK